MYFRIKSSEVLFQLQPKVELTLNLERGQKGHSCNLLAEVWSLSAELSEKWVGTVAGKHPAGTCSHGKCETVMPCSDWLIAETNILYKEVRSLQTDLWYLNLVLMTTFDLQRAANHRHWLWHEEAVQYTVPYSGGARATPHMFDFRSRRRRVALWNVVVSWVEEVNLPPLEVSKALWPLNSNLAGGVLSWLTCD